MFFFLIIYSFHSFPLNQKYFAANHCKEDEESQICFESAFLQILFKVLSRFEGFDRLVFEIGLGMEKCETVTF